MPQHCSKYIECYIYIDTTSEQTPPPELEMDFICLLDLLTLMDLRRPRVINLLIAAFLVLGVLSPPGLMLRAQNPTAQLSGTISDQSGVPVPEAQVRITGVATGLEQVVTTNTEGQFVFPVLQPGEYRVTIRKEGFTQLTRSGIVLAVSQTGRLDAQLQVGSATQSVEVRDALPALETDSASNGQTIQTQAVNDLPLNGRNFLQLAKLAPGVLPPKPGDRGAAGGSFVANGVRAQVNNYMLDGIDNNTKIVDLQNSSPVVIQPSVDALQEFRIETNNYSAQYGYSAGAVVNATIKSGTNQLHGDGFEFLRNSEADARNYFLPATTPTPIYQRNQFGGTLGGPIKRDKVFLFGSYEGTRLKSALSTITETIPTAQQIAGNFAGQPTIYDPNTLTQTGATFRRAAFAGNMIPANRVDPLAAKLLALLPQPNVGGAAFNNYIANPEQTQTADRYDSRMDASLGSRDQFFARYSYFGGSNFLPGAYPPPLVGYASFSLTRDENTTGQGVGVGDTHSFSASLVNEFRLGYNRISDNLSGINKTDTPASFGFNGIPTLAGLTGLPQISISGFTNLGDSTSEPNAKISEAYSAEDHVSWLTGRHHLTFGGTYRWVRSFFNASNAARGSFAFNGSFTQNPLSRTGNGSALADFLLGLPSTSEVSTPTAGDLRYRYAGAFVQDDWKIASRLTLNLGLRYELWTQPVERHDDQANFLPQLGRIVYALNKTPVAVPPSLVARVPDDVNFRTLMTTRKKNFSPRVGVAYQVAKNTVVRSGFGIFYADEPFIGGSGRLPANPPFFRDVTFPTDQLHPVTQLSAGFAPNTLTSSFNVANASLISWAQDFSNGYVMHWSFGLQQQIARFTTEANYVGTKGVDLPSTFNLNAALPGSGTVASRRPYQGYSDITRTQPLDSTSYHALELRLQREWSNGVTILAAYTYSKSIDIGGEQLIGDANIRDARNVALEKARATSDLRHNFVTSYSYALPFGHGRHFDLKNGLLNATLGEWQINGITTIRSGLPFTPELGVSAANTGDPRPNRIANGNVPSDQRTIGRWFDKTAFTTPVPFTFGNAGRDILEGPGAVNFDLSVFKDFSLSKVRENSKLQLRFESFNTLNHPQFANPSNRVDLPQGGTISALAAGSNMRDLQAGIKLIF